MIQNTYDFGHVPGDPKAIQSVCRYYNYDGFAAAKRPQTINSVSSAYILDSFRVPGNMPEIRSFVYHLRPSMLPPLPRALAEIMILADCLAEIMLLTQFLAEIMISADFLAGLMMMVDFGGPPPGSRLPLLGPDCPFWVLIAPSGS